MLARLRFGRALVGVARIPVFACALVLLVGTVTISGANVLIREGLRAWAETRAGRRTRVGTNEHERRRASPGANH